MKLGLFLTRLFFVLLVGIFLVMSIQYDLLGPMGDSALAIIRLVLATISRAFAGA